MVSIWEQAQDGRLSGTADVTRRSETRTQARAALLTKAVDCPAHTGCVWLGPRRGGEAREGRGRGGRGSLSCITAGTKKQTRKRKSGESAAGPATRARDRMADVLCDDGSRAGVQQQACLCLWCFRALAGTVLYVNLSYRRLGVCRPLSSAARGCSKLDISIAPGRAEYAPPLAAGSAGVTGVETILLLHAR